MFLVCTWSVVPGWLLLIFAPRAKWTRRLIAGGLLPCALALVYLFLMVTHGWASGPPLSLEKLALSFTNRQLLLAAWLHYLVVDILVGAWQVADAERLGIRHAAVVPCLLLTCFFGPLGVLAYFSLRWFASTPAGRD